VIADPDYFGKFMARAALLPYSRELYEEFLRAWPAIHDPVEQTVRWYYVARQSFSGQFGASRGTGISTSPTERWRSSFDNLPNLLSFYT
jgi:site-specific DNA-adenine methylase